MFSFNAEHRILQSFQLYQVLLDFVVSMSSVNLVNGIVQIFQFHHPLVDVVEVMFTLDIVNWAFKFLQAVHSLFNLGEVIFVNDIVAGTKEHLYISQPSFYLGKLVFPLYLIHRPCQRLDLIYLYLHFTKGMVRIHSLSYRIAHLLELFHLPINLIKVMFPVHIVHRTLQLFEVNYLTFELGEHIGMFHIEHGILEVLG